MGSNPPGDIILNIEDRIFVDGVYKKTAEPRHLAQFDTLEKAKKYC